MLDKPKKVINWLLLLVRSTKTKAQQTDVSNNTPSGVKDVNRKMALTSFKTKTNKILINLTMRRRVNTVIFSKETKTTLLHCWCWECGVGKWSQTTYKQQQTTISGGAYLFPKLYTKQQYRFPSVDCI